jgi:hypothetical protein
MQNKSNKFFSEKIDSILRQALLSYSDISSLRNEVDFYGASKILAKQLGYNRVPLSYSSWTHGATSVDLKFPEQIQWCNHWVLNRLVANEEVENFLNSFGYDKVKKVGLPITYVPSLNVKRRKNSILIMLPHTLPYLPFDHRLEEIVPFCYEMQSKGFYICFCVHKDCFLRGELPQELNKCGFDWFVGSSPNDLNSLQRMRNIFEYFETVGSNSIGSPFYYSQLFGAKYFFLQPFFEHELNWYQKDPYWQNHINVLEYILNETSEAVLRKKWPEYFKGPEMACCNRNLAEAKCGVNNKAPLKELTKLLGWELKDQFKYFAPYYGSKLNKKIARKALSK